MEPEGPDAVRKALYELIRKDRQALGGQKLDSLIRCLDKLEMVGKLLFRRVYDSVSNQVELRCVVPTGNVRVFDFPGRVRTDLEL